MIFHAVVLAFSLAISACGTSSPIRTIETDIVFHSRPTIYVIAAKQKPETIKALRVAKVDIVNDLIDSTYQLRVTLGVDKGFRSCGTLNNVKYALRKEGTTVIEIQGRGWTGTCKPGVFEEMSQELKAIILRRMDTKERS